MLIQIAVRHDTTDGRIKTFVEEELKRIEGKYSPISAEVVIDQEGAAGHVKTAEINVTVPGKVLHTKESSSDVNKSIDLAVKTIEAQLHKYKETHAHPTALKRHAGQVEPVAVEEEDVAADIAATEDQD
ncbi:MAG: ribosome-associated translation inhibitor RaiA [Candidatus Kapaibacterium sp.]|jgi:ribosomal subunit interface protein